MTVAPEGKAQVVWRLLEHLGQTIRDAGGDPIPYSWLTENLRPGATALGQSGE